MEKYSTRVNDKIKSLKIWIDQLEKIIPSNFEKYKSDFIISSACERLSEKIIEDILKTCNIILKEKGINNREKPFEILNDLEILSSSLTKNLEQIKGMRNLMIHNYDSFDEEIFYNSLKNLIIDSKNFIKEINKK